MGKNNAAAGGPRVMVVEDEPLIAMHISDCLEEWGYDVCGVVDRHASAVRLADERRPDLALVDVDLRDGDDGVSLAAEMMRRFDTAVLFVTASADATTQGRIAGLSRCGCVIKPFMPMELRTAVDDALLRHRQPPVKTDH